MRIAYLDCFSGVSGDMFLGALVDAGVSSKLLEDTVAALNIGARLEISRVMRSGISATKVDVYANGEKDLPRKVFSRQQENQHEHSHHHHPESHSHSHSRALPEIRRIIEKAAISTSAKQTAIKIFEALGQAESEIHNTSIEQVHFHEVGAVDALVDIVCAAVGAESLAVDEWICSPLNVGSGTVKCAHGTLPVPAPATLKLLSNAQVYSSGPQVELVTPTGAAIVKTLTTRFAPFPAMKIEKAGYGAGTRDFPDHPNLLRLTIGETTQAGSHPQIAGHLQRNRHCPRSESRRSQPASPRLRHGAPAGRRRARRIQCARPNEKEPSRRTANRPRKNRRRDPPDQFNFRRDHDSRRPPPRRATSNALPTLGNRHYNLGPRAN